MILLTLSVACLCLFRQVMTFSIEKGLPRFKGSNYIYHVSDSTSMSRKLLKLGCLMSGETDDSTANNPTLLTPPNRFSSEYGSLFSFVSNLLQGGGKLRYSSTAECGGHIVQQYFKYIPREEESALAVKLFEIRQQFRKGFPLRATPDYESEFAESEVISVDKANNPLISLVGAPGSGKSCFLRHFSESQAYTNYSNDRDVVIVSTVTFNSSMDGGEPAFGLRVLYGFLKAMCLLSPGNTYSKWIDFYHHFEEFKNIEASEVIDMMSIVLDTSRNKLEFLVLIDELSKSKDIALRMNLPADEISRTPERIMSQIGVLLSNYDNVNVVVSSLSPQFIEELLTPASKRRIAYVIPRPLIGSSLGASACKYITDYLIDSMNGTKYCPDPTNVKIMKNLYLLLSGHPRSLEYMSSSMMNDPDVWCGLKQEMCKDNKHSSFLMTALDVLDRYVKAVPKISLDDYKTMSKYVFAAERTTATEKSSRILLESGYLQIYEASNDDFILMSPSFVALRWMYGSHKLPIDPIKNNMLYQIQKLTENFSDLRLSYMMEYIMAITIVSHSYERNEIDSILGGSSSYRPFGKALNFKVKYEENITNNDNLILPNHMYMAKVNQQGYDMRVVTKDHESDIPLYYYLQVKIRLPTTEPLVKVTAKMIQYNLKHYQSVCPKLDFQSLYMYLYIWDNVSKDMMSQQDLINELMSLKLEGTNDTIKFINDYYDHLIIMNKFDLKKWILPSLVAIPYFLQEVTDQTAEM